MFRLHLKGKGHSERLVRYQLLAATQVEQCEATAGRSLGAEASMIEFRTAAARAGLEIMIREVSDPVPYEMQEVEENGKKTTQRVARTDKAKFRAVAPEELHQAWDQLFTVKDTVVLRQIYNDEHMISKDELDEIMAGKVEEVD